MDFSNLHSSLMLVDQKQSLCHDWAHVEETLVDVPPLSMRDPLVPLFDGFNQFSELSYSSYECSSSSALVPLPCMHYNSYSLLHNSSQLSFDDIDLDSIAWDDNLLLPSINDAVSLNIIDGDLNDDHVMHGNKQPSGANVASRGEQGVAMEGCNSRRLVKLSEIGVEEIRSYFYMPITRAAKEMNVGLTVLKKRCRELGIPRWPHRKMKSLRSLIHNVQELGKGGQEDIRNELKKLEEQKRLMEENPEIELTDRTKKLRQACFKANYKKRRLMHNPHTCP